MPPHIKLSEAEEEVFAWYVANGASALGAPTDRCGVAGGGRALQRGTRVGAREKYPIRDGDAIAGVGDAEASPFAHLERKLTAELRGLLAELGMTPAGRLKIAPPMDGGLRESTGTASTSRREPIALLWSPRLRFAWLDWKVRRMMRRTFGLTPMEVRRRAAPDAAKLDASARWAAHRPAHLDT